MTQVILALITIFATSVSFAESCQLIVIKEKQEAIVDTITLSGRSNSGIIPKTTIKYNITSMPGPVDAIYLTDANSVVRVSGAAASSEAPLFASFTDLNGNGAAVRCSN